LRHIIHFEESVDVGASVPVRCDEDLKHWFDESASLLQAAEAALPLEQLAIYRGHDKAAKLALDYKLLNDGTIPAGILHRYEYIATPFRDLGWILLQALATLGIPGGDKSPSLYKRQGRERARF
jgi:hypothetical protein